MKKEGFWRELARDFVALGSIPVLILVIARVWILDNPAYLSQFLIGGILFLILAFIFRSDLYSGLGLVMTFFLVLFYNELKFTIFIILVYIGLLISLFYLNVEKKKILKGFLFGVLSTAVSYYAVKFIF